MYVQGPSISDQVCTTVYYAFVTHCKARRPVGEGKPAEGGREGGGREPGGGEASGQTKQQFYERGINAQITS